MESLEKQLGNRIKTLRKLRGWTQENLAEQAKVSVQHVGEIERGDGNPTLQSLERLSKGFGITVSQLLTVEDPDQETELLRDQICETVQEMPTAELKLLQGVINLAKSLSLRMK